MGAVNKNARGKYLFKPCDLTAGQHRSRAGRVIENGGNLAYAPKTEQKDWERGDIWEQYANPLHVGNQRIAHRSRQQVSRDQNSAEGQRLATGVLDDDLFRIFSGGGGNRIEQMCSAKFHFNVELLADHAVAQPSRQLRARL